jgi:hypothetical protein
MAQRTERGGAEWRHRRGLGPRRPMRAPAGRRRLGVEDKVILTPPCVFCMDNHSNEIY